MKHVTTPSRPARTALQALLFTLVCLFTSTLLGSCSKDDDQPLKFDDVTLYAGNTQTIDNAKGLTWTSSNDLIATLKDGKLEAKLVGKATLTSSAGSFSVTVLPVHTLFTEPCLDFGIPRSAARSRMERYFEFLESSGNTDFYEGKGIVYLYGCHFENNLLKMSIATFKLSYASDLTDYLLERYIPIAVDKDKGTAGFVNPQKDMMVVYWLGYPKISFVSILYAPIDDSSSSSATSRSIKRRMEQLTPALPQPAATLTPEAKAERQALFTRLSSQLKPLAE